MAKKAPRRTAERILEAALALFNRFGEPNVSTTVIAAQLGISPGNLYYHYPAKEELVNALLARYEAALSELLPAAGEVSDVEDAWFFMHTLFESIWRYRFLLRDLNDLLSRNRTLETHMQQLLERKRMAMRALLGGIERTAGVRMEPAEADCTAASMVVLLTYWLSYEYARDPRHALEAQSAQRALMRGAHHSLHLLVPYLQPQQRAHLLELARAYGGEDEGGA